MLKYKQSAFPAAAFPIRLLQSFLFPPRSGLLAMVYLNRLYTKTGDTGETSLGDGARVPKTHPRVVACGAVDELNAAVGMVLALGQPPERIVPWLQCIQNDLFDVGADLCVPEVSDAPTSPAASALRITPDYPARIERWIDELTAEVAPLQSFVLPGGTAAAACLHLARTVCRRAELDVLRLIDAQRLSTRTAEAPNGQPAHESHEPAGTGSVLRINPEVVIYLNRLSDFLFAAARWANSLSCGDVLWVAGGRPPEAGSAN